MKYLKREGFDRANLFGAGQTNDTFSQYFTGVSFLSPMVLPNEDMPLFISNVTFEPGCRTCWHIHTSDGAGGQQILICIAGEGWYVEEGKPTVELKEGVTVVIPANVKHWHGARKDSWFSHISIAAPGVHTDTVWCEHVTDEEYDKLD
ncbi:MULTISPECIES: cupin domain-containing protein [unclassified Clostridium]|uniref:cupin domain-containing protein n=1 Tax=unclassified Clostridium TaxID=2614128 RepID=UPI001106DE67|nr:MULTISPECIES: cupin domain-containing protein [unclassified Clostridium]